MAINVNEPCAAYKAMEADWKLVRALWGGTRAMRTAGESYLPREPKEGAEAYRIRLARTTLFNAFRRTIKSLVGKPFSKAVTLGDDVPPSVAEWTDNIDLAGRDISVFSRDVFEDAMAAGLSHILVDYPPAPLGRTLADERQSGARPYWVHIKAENLIGWKATLVGGVAQLTQIRIMETATVESGDFDENSVPQVRVIEPGRYRLYRPDASRKDEYVLFEEGVTSLKTVVPLVTVYTGRTGFMTAEPPLLDLAHLNVEHWQSSSDQGHILHVARVPLLFGSGFSEADGTTLEIGPNRLITGPNGADLKYVEHTGAAIDSGRMSIQDIEDRMVTMGLELEVRKPGNQTATAKVIDTAESDSELHAMVGNLKDSLEKALDLTATWALIGTDGGTVSMNTDFGVSQREATEIDVLLKARLAREISRATFLAELARRGVFDEDFSPQDEIDKISEEGPALGTMTDTLGGAAGGDTLTGGAGDSLSGGTDAPPVD